MWCILEIIEEDQVALTCTYLPSDLDWVGQVCLAALLLLAVAGCCCIR